MGELCKKFNDFLAEHESLIKFAQLLVTVIIAGLGMYLTYSFNRGQSEVAASNMKIASVNVMTQFFNVYKTGDAGSKQVLLKILGSCDAERQVQYASLFAMYDKNPVVTSAAVSSLINSAKSGDAEVRTMARKALSSYDLKYILKEKKLDILLAEAAGYAHGGPNNINTALEKYQEVIKHLPKEGLAALDQQMLEQVRKECEAGDNTHAIRTYAAIFADYTSSDEGK